MKRLKLIIKAEGDSGSGKTTALDLIEEALASVFLTKYKKQISEHQVKLVLEVAQLGSLGLKYDVDIAPRGQS